MTNKRRRRRTLPRADAARAMPASYAPGNTLMSPGEAPPPAPGMVPPDATPRQFSFPIGYNIATRPRTYEENAFETLRAFAALYSGVQLCERVYLDIIGRLTPQVVSREDGQPAKGEDARRAHALLTSPDGERDLREWLSAATRDLLEIDAVAVYRRRRRDGRLFGLDLVDGMTIKPLLDITGRRPEPPAPAYQQFVWGVPAGRYAIGEMDYLRESPRVDSPYGFSRVERILFSINHALRKQHYDLARFTDGVVPAGLLLPPPEFPWTPEQVGEYERGFNAMLAGNDQLRARVKVLPPGFTFAAMDQEAPTTDFDRWLLNVTAACFGLTMAELGMTEQVNKSSGETQENVVYRRAVRPLANFFARYLSRVVAEEVAPDLMVTWQPLDEPEDFVAQTGAMVQLVGAGIITPARAAALLGLASIEA